MNKELKNDNEKSKEVFVWLPEKLKLKCELNQENKINKSTNDHMLNKIIGSCVIFTANH